jgi:uncharacterized lipoprotein YddW (UPF0748 family)
LADLPPKAPREFRAAWIATVANIDWPSRTGLSSYAQQAEMCDILDKAVALKLNAIVLQVRTSADALYASELEPWSEYLTGFQGQAPEPFYDPLAAWIAEAHSRGLELHAWFNPFRARQSKAVAASAKNHLSQSHPEWVKFYGDQLWIDPGEPAAADHTIAVFMDVLQRYDVDGIHIDDYFYPYPITQTGEIKIEVDFPDQPAWQRYVESGGSLSRDDWRRSNVDALIERIYREIHQTKPWIRFGVSPFGLGRPELRPPGIQGFSQYHKLYANVERWLAEGWMDYLVPQLYWAIDQKEQAFVPLLDYWHAQNSRGRHVWVGLFTSRVAASDAVIKSGWSASEIVSQIDRVREHAPGSGHVHFSMSALAQNRQELTDTLQASTYRAAALVPITPWLTDERKPIWDAQVQRKNDQAYQLILTSPHTGARWAVWLRYGTRWELALCGSNGMDISTRSTQDDPVSGVVISAIDRVGNEGPRYGFTVEEWKW